MPLDPYWDTPEYTPEAIAKLKLELDGRSQYITLTKAEIDKCYNEEQELKMKMQLLRDKRDALYKKKSNAELEYGRLRTIEIDLLEELAKQEEIARLNGEISALEAEINKLLEGTKFWNAVMPFQREDVLYAVNAWRMGLTGILNANDMGLGKTYESLVMYYVIDKLFVEKHSRPMHTIWITKKSLIKSTVRELKEWHPDLNIIPLVGIVEPAMRKFVIDMAWNSNAILITNYESLTSVPELSTEYTWDMIFMDEVHKLKGGANQKPTQVWQAARTLVHKSRNAGGFYIPLSGSPISNHPKEMWAYLHLFDPVRFPNARTFESTYCSWYGSGYAVKPDILIKAMKSQVIRRRRDEVAIQLPEITHDWRYVDHTEAQAVAYGQMRNEFFTWLSDASDGEDKPLTATAIIAQLNRLRQINVWADKFLNREIGSGKIDEAMEIIIELADTGEQTVVFSSQFNDPLYEIKKRCLAQGLTCAIIDGSTTNIDDLCEDFRQGKINVMAVNMKTGGEGLNLQKSDRWPGGAAHAIFVDLWWNPMINEQAEARIYRKGANQPVVIHVLQVDGSVDGFIKAILDNKTEMITGVMESEALRKGDWKNKLEGLI